MLMNKVPHGKPLPNHRPNQSPTAQRASPPNAEPAATDPI
jgi:hypothetical protein